MDELGFVWIRPFRPERDAAALGGVVGYGRSGPGGLWRVFTPDGEEVGQVEIPAGLEPYQVTEDKVLGVYFDELGVEYVRVYELVRQ